MQTQIANEANPESLPSGGKSGQGNSLKGRDLNNSEADRFVRSAIKLMREKGYHQTTFDDIAEDICVSVKEISDCFKSREDICLQVIAWHDARLSEIFVRTEEHSNPRQRLSCLIDSLIDEADVLVKYGCPITRLYLDLRNEGSKLEKAATKLIIRRLDWIKEQFHLMSFVDEAPDLATRLAGALYGVTLLSSAADDEAMLRNQMNQLKSWIRSM
ncbi:TetR/AcrR family transcriptional regulator [Emcibacter sp.]|uniref:TetR/AcrR family transcriptional regulator n=1 Tax=Emcibacter sp. TaxID=1979954 RepID=UPI002AA725B4|nr:TetR/AcrR family transcriptional regulator [Emcibacter sp.]